MNAEIYLLDVSKRKCAILDRGEDAAAAFKQLSHQLGVTPPTSSSVWMSKLVHDASVEQGFWWFAAVD